MDLSPSTRREVFAKPQRLADTRPALTTRTVPPSHDDRSPTTDEQAGGGSSRARHQLVSRASEFLSSHAADGVRISELARVAGVSERTLRNAFQAEHGLSPKKFDLRERLVGARRALCSAESARKTVTSIACEFGFFELGRFALIYKRLFGESPSETIKAHHHAIRSNC